MLDTDDPEEETSLLTWGPPDLRPGHPWYNARVTNLMEGTKELPNCDEIQRQGIEALSIHRQNYDEFGPLMWLHEAYSLRLSHRRDPEGQHLTLAMDTIRQLRSAASQFLSWELMVSRPSGVYMDQQQRILEAPCRSTDSLAFTLFMKGMSARVGNETRPSVPLLDRHVRYMDQVFDSRYRTATSPAARRLWSLVGLANLVFWLGWLRSSETFGLRWCDFQVVSPHDGPVHDLPYGLGALLLRLQPETKSNRLSTADVAIAFETRSGFQIGRWFHRAQRHGLGGLDGATNSSPAFTRDDGLPWTSAYFRQTFIYPLLHQQQQEGDAYLSPFDGSPGNSIADKFWSLHFYRRGANTHVSRGGLHGGIRFRRATSIQSYEHARWRRRRSSERIHLQYQQWPLLERLKLTLFCQ
jgi:hypothetical protein